MGDFGIFIRVQWFHLQSLVKPLEVIETIKCRLEPTQYYQTTGVFQRGSSRILLFSDYLRCCGLILDADSIAITEKELWMVNEQTSGQF